MDKHAKVCVEFLAVVNEASLHELCDLLDVTGKGFHAVAAELEALKWENKALASSHAGWFGRAPMSKIHANARCMQSYMIVLDEIRDAMEVLRAEINAERTRKQPALPSASEVRGKFEAHEKAMGSPAGISEMTVSGGYYRGKERDRG